MHAGYAKRRKALLAAGIALYEMKRESAGRRRQDARARQGSSARACTPRRSRSTAARVFVGSFNFDPRSARLNTEMGFVIDSPTLARRLADAFDERVPDNAYEVRLDEAGALQWIQRQGHPPVLHSEPGAGALKRALIWLLSLLPIEWLL